MSAWNYFVNTAALSLVRQSDDKTVGGFRKNCSPERKAGAQEEEEEGEQGKQEEEETDVSAVADETRKEKKGSVSKSQKLRI